MYIHTSYIKSSVISPVYLPIILYHHGNEGPHLDTLEVYQRCFSRGDPGTPIASWFIREHPLNCYENG